MKINQMNISPLVQRCSVKTEKRSEIFGIDTLLAYQYMGSSEFEFNQLFRNLSAILPHLDEYRIVSTDLKCQSGKRIFLVCTKEQSEAASAWVGQEAYKNVKGLKEPTYLLDNLNGTSDNSGTNVDVWWVLEDSLIYDMVNYQNVWFFCKSKETARLLLSALQKSKAKRANG